MSTAAEMHPEEYRNGHRFGFGTDYKIISIASSSQEIHQRALDLGWSSGCPVSKRLTSTGEGAISMMLRYAQVNEVFRLVVDEAGDKNLPLAQKLENVWGRLPEEDPRNWEPDSVPPSYLNLMNPIVAPYGYAIPRIMIERIGRRLPMDKEMLDLFQRNLDLPIRQAQTAHELMITLAERMFLDGADPKLILSHAYSREVLDEENCRIRFIVIASAMEERTPKLWEVYQNLKRDEKVRLGIAEIPLKNSP